MNRRRFLQAGAWLAAGASLGIVAGCSSDTTQAAQAGREADNKQVLDSAAANNKAAAGNSPRKKSRKR